MKKPQSATIAAYLLILWFLWFVIFKNKPPWKGLFTEQTEDYKRERERQYDRFHHLNDLAAEICATTDAVLLNVADMLEM